jgi:phosphatidylglycerophosphatase A
MRLKLRPGRLPEGMTLAHPAALVATWFGSGLAPIASGTWGSLAALPYGWLLQHYFGITGLIVGALAATIAGIWASGVIVTRGRIRDPGLIVIDEVAGMTLTLIGAPQTWWGYVLAFLLFRAADIFKPFPANWCDANIHGGIGVMLDDLVAGVYAALGTWLLSEYFLRDYLASFGL